MLARIVVRETRDLDFFGPSADDVDALAGAVEAALLETGMDVRRERRRSTRRVVVRDLAIAGVPTERVGRTHPLVREER
jgi:hypothetical protein